MERSTLASFKGGGGGPKLAVFLIFFPSSLGILEGFAAESNIQVFPFLCDGLPFLSSH